MAGTTRRMTTIETEGGACDGHLTLPEAGSGPGVLLLQEIWGVGDFIHQKAADLASAGYVVLAPDVFWRVERNVSLPHDDAGLKRGFELMGRYSEEVPLETKVGDLVSSLEHLKSLPEVAGHKSAVLGYCLGGFLAYLVAAHGEPDGCVSYYGSGIADMLQLKDRISCPVLFHFGGRDPYISGEQVERIAAAFAGRDDVEVRIEPEAGHAFENLLAPGFGVGEAAARSWAATLEWLGGRLS